MYFIMYIVYYWCNYAKKKAWKSVLEFKLSLRLLCVLWIWFGANYDAQFNIHHAVTVYSKVVWFPIELNLYTSRTLEQVFDWSTFPYFQILSKFVKFQVFSFGSQNTIGLIIESWWCFERERDTARPTGTGWRSMISTVLSAKPQGMRVCSACIKLGNRQIDLDKRPKPEV